MLHPAFPDCPGHEIWKRDFTGSASLFSVVFASQVTPEQVIAFVNTLELVKIGWSWGGVTSLVMTYPSLDRLVPERRARIVRFNIGLEEVEDLRADLAGALKAIR